MFYDILGFKIKDKGGEMMKKITVLAMIICFFISIMPVFLGSVAYGETVFQTLGNSISKMGKQDPERRQTEWTTIFQKATRNISTWDNNASATKSLSLRGNKAELMRRRGL